MRTFLEASQHTCCHGREGSHRVLEHAGDCVQEKSYCCVYWADMHNFQPKFLKHRCLRLSRCTSLQRSANGWMQSFKLPGWNLSAESWAKLGSCLKLFTIPEPMARAACCIFKLGTDSAIQLPLAGLSDDRRLWQAVKWSASNKNTFATESRRGKNETKSIWTKWFPNCSSYRKNTGFLV